MRSETIAEHINSRRQLGARLLTFVSFTILCFIPYSLILGIAYCYPGHSSDQMAIHVGMLQDLAWELPTGRQALVSSLSDMPLSSLAALPFLPFLKPTAYGFAYLYGLAALLALSAMPLRRLLCTMGLSRIQAAAPFALALAALLLGPTEWIDLLACLPMLILAFYFETLELPELRALAGIFWALSIFANLAGALLFLLRLAWALFNRLTSKCNSETRAVQWIQGVSILYVFGVYLFLNWMIMGSPVYPFVNAKLSLPSGNTARYKEELAKVLASQYSDCRPVVSGLWGYAVRPLLDLTDGCHFIDFYPEKLMDEEPGDIVLIIPAGGNPFTRLNDIRPDASCLHGNFISQQNFKKTDNWIFIRFKIKNSAVPTIKYP